MMIHINALERQYLDMLLSDAIISTDDFRQCAPNEEVKDSFSRVIDVYVGLLHKVKRAGEYGGSEV